MAHQPSTPTTKGIVPAFVSFNSISILVKLCVLLKDKLGQYSTFFQVQCCTYRGRLAKFTYPNETADAYCTSRNLPSCCTVGHFRMVQMTHGAQTQQPVTHGHHRGHHEGLVRVAAMHLLAQRPHFPTGEKQPCNLPPQRSAKPVML